MQKLSRQRIATFILSPAVVLVFAACDLRAPHVNLNGKNIICFGDSITEGVGVSQGENFPALLGQMLNRSVINAGKGGDTTRDALKRLEGDVLEKNPGLVIVEFAGNDYLQRISKEETFKNLDQILTTIQKHGAMVALAAVRIGFFYDEYYRGFKEIAQKRRVLLIPDIMQNVFDNPQLKSDYIHPNAEGYKIVAARIYKYIAPLIRRSL